MRACDHFFSVPIKVRDLTRDHVSFGAETILYIVNIARVYFFILRSDFRIHIFFFAKSRYDCEIGLFEQQRQITSPNDLNPLSDNVL